MATGTEIERLFVKIEGDIAGLKTSMGRAMGEVDKAQKSMGGNLATLVTRFKSVEGAALVMGGGVALAGVALLRGAQQAVQYADNLADTATALGLNVERLQEYRYAAVQSGVAQEEMDRAVGKLNLTIGSAVREGGAAAEKFNRLGIAFKDAAGNARPTDDVLRDLSDRIAGMGSAAERTAAAGDLVGDKLGPKMQALLARGAAGLDSLSEAARRAGAVIDKDTIQRAAEAQDKLDGLAMVTKAQLTVALADLAPVLVKIAEGMVAVARAAAAASTAMRALLGADPVPLEEDLRDLEERIAGVNVELQNARGLKNNEEAVKRYEQQIAGLTLQMEILRDRQKEALGMGPVNLDRPRGEIAEPESPTDLDRQQAVLDAMADYEDALKKRLEEGAAERKKIRDEDAQDALDSQAQLLADLEEYTAENDKRVAAARADAQRALKELSDRMGDDFVASEIARNDRIIADEYATLEERQAALDARAQLERTAAETEYTERMAALDALKVETGEEEEKRRRAKEKLELTHQNNLTQIEQDAAAARRVINDQEWSARFEAASITLNSLSTLMSSHSKKAFNVGKAAALAQASIDAIGGAARALKDFAAPYSYVVAAATLAAGLARVQQIRSISFGGGSGSAAGGASPALPSGGAATAAGAGGSGSGSAGNIYISLKGQDLFSSDAVRQLIERISEAQGDGSKIRVVS